MITVHRQQVRARPSDGQVTVDYQFAARERNCLPIQRRIEIDRVAGGRITDRLTQRTRAVVVVIGDSNGRRRYKTKPGKRQWNEKDTVPRKRPVSRFS